MSPDRASAVVARAASGDRVAFTELVATHHADMLGLAGAILGDPDSARDAVQVAWQRAWIGLSALRDESRVRSWLLSVAGNEARRAVRGSRRSAGFLSPDVLADLPAFPPHADSDNLGYEDFALEQALDRLDPRDRELLSLRYVLGFSSVELSAHCGISPEGIRSRLKRVLDRIRGELTDE